MKMSKNMAKIAAIATVLLMASVMLMAMPLQLVEAQQLLQSSVILSPDQVPATAFRVKTTPYLSFRPNPVGLNQIFIVNVWVNPPVHRSRKFTGYKITIQKPSGDTDVITMDSYYADTTAWFEYIADEEGTWKIKFEFPGGYFSKANLTGGFMEPSVVTYGECYYEPSSTDWQELIVKKDYVALSWPPSPLPTDYWTRPISPENREWWSIAGNFPWYGPASGGPDWETLWNKLYPNTNKYWSDRYSFIPWVQAPNSAHIVWKRQGAISGLIGGDLGQLSITTGGGSPTIIYAGRCYQSFTKPFNGITQTVWQCYDLRTGEIYWERTGVGSYIPSVIEYTRGTEAVPGAISGVSFSVSLVYIGGGRLVKYDPWTGAVSRNESISPLTTGTYYRNGYALSVQTIGTQYYLINWTTLGTATTFKSRIITNISWPCPALPGQYVTARGICVADYNAGLAAFITRVTHPQLGIYYGANVTGINLKTGAVLWTISIPDETTYSSSCIVADHGKVAFLTQNGYWLAYNLADGSFAWKSDRMDYPWDAPSFGAYAVQSAYGMFYRQAYSGVYAFNWTNGKIVWKYEAPTPYPYETTYIDANGTGVYSFNAGGWVADGKLYTYNTEHTPSQPITRGWRLHCINATTGKGIWNITGSMSVGAIADGYLVASNSYDGYTYCFGKGKSQTSVAVSQDVVAKGSTVLVKGSVLDMSPAQPGTPCVAKESMTVWMEYLHMQKAYPSDVKGVPVTLTAIKSDGKVIDLGTVTTNGFYGTFSFAWTPPEEGTYTIIACFMGDDSYGSSSAATVITVGPPPPEPETPEIPTPTDYMPMLTGLTIAVVIAIIIGIYSIYDHRRLMRK
jgi:hypothetical protein